MGSLMSRKPFLVLFLWDLLTYLLTVIIDLLIYSTLNEHVIWEYF